MIQAKSTLLLLLLFVAFAYASLRRDGNAKEIQRTFGDSQKKKVFQDDGEFWTRFVQQVSASIPASPSTPKPTAPRPVQQIPPRTPEPTTSRPRPEPTPPPSRTPEPTTSRPRPEPTPPPSRTPKPATLQPRPEPTPPPTRTPEPTTSRPRPDPTPRPTRTLEPTTSRPRPEPTLPPTRTPEPTISRPRPEPTSPSVVAPESCSGSTQITCVAADGTACSDMASPDITCGSGSYIEIVSFILEFSRCAEGNDGQHGSCSDEGDLPDGTEMVRITCIDLDDNLLFSQNVGEGSEVTISGDGALPGTIFCSIFSSSGDLLQTFDINTQSDDLFLLNKFGSLTLVSCGDVSCFTDVTYKYTAENTGDVPVTVITFERNREGDILNLLPEIKPIIQSGKSQSATETETINICEEGGYFTSLIMQESTTECEYEADYYFAFAPETPLPFPNPTPEPTPAPTPGPTPAPTPKPTPELFPETSPLLTPKPAPPDPNPAGPAPVSSPAPTPGLTPELVPETSQPVPIVTSSPTTGQCEFAMSIECPDCNATPPPVEQCTGRPLAMSWIYSGGGCENSWNVQGEKFICEDFNGGPPTNLGEKSFIVVTDKYGDITYHEDYVEVGSLYNHDSGGEPFSSYSLITIYKNNNTDDLANLLQSVQYQSSCSSTLFLKNRFGASILVQWTNEEQGTISCFANQTLLVEVNVPIDIQGGPATVTSLTIASNVDPFFFNLTEGVAGLQVDGGNTFQSTLTVPIDLSVKTIYNMLVTMEAETGGGTTCTASEMVSFTAGYPLPPIFPTIAPTGPPDRM